MGVHHARALACQEKHRGGACHKASCGFGKPEHGAHTRRANVGTQTLRSGKFDLDQYRGESLGALLATRWQFRCYRSDLTCTPKGTRNLRGSQQSKVIWVHLPQGSCSSGSPSLRRGCFFSRSLFFRRRHVCCRSTIRRMPLVTLWRAASVTASRWTGQCVSPTVSKPIKPAHPPISILMPFCRRPHPLRSYTRYGRLIIWQYMRPLHIIQAGHRCRYSSAVSKLKLIP